MPKVFFYISTVIFPIAYAPKASPSEKGGTELLLCLIIAKINFYIIRVMVKSLKYDVSTIIISNFY